MSDLLAAELDDQPVPFDEGQVLDEAAERHRTRRCRGPHALLVGTCRLPREGPPVAFEDRGREWASEATEKGSRTRACSAT
jgi:hypothetical protein